MTRTVTLPNLLAALPFKAGTVVMMEVRADGSIVLSDADTPIQAAYGAGLLTCASEALELLASREDGGKTVRPFAMTAYTGSPMNLKGSERVPTIIDLAGMRVPAKSLPIHREHDPERIVAHTSDVDISERRLRVAGLMSGVGPAAQEVLQLADNGFPWQASVGASCEKREEIAAGRSIKVNGRSWDGPLVVARKTTLREISFVSMGADPTTSATVAGEQP